LELEPASRLAERAGVKNRASHVCLRSGDRDQDALALPARHEPSNYGGRRRSAFRVDRSAFPRGTRVRGGTGTAERTTRNAERKCRRASAQTQRIAEFTRRGGRGWSACPCAPAGAP